MAIQLAYLTANERAAHRFILAFRPLVRIFLGTHIRRSIEDLIRGYTYLAVSLDTSAPDSAKQSAWLEEVRDELRSFAEHLTTWRSSLSALVGVPLITTISSVLYKVAGTEDLPGTIVKFAPPFFRNWPIWLPAILYLAFFVSWSYALKRRLLLGERSTSDSSKIPYPHPVYQMEAKLIKKLPVRRRKELPLDLLLPAIPWIFFGAQTVWLPFSGLRNNAGEAPPPTSIFGGVFLVGSGVSYLLAIAWRKVA
jgi:hypothetical protein